MGLLAGTVISPFLLNEAVALIHAVTVPLLPSGHSYTAVASLVTR
jgi:hypothetical protein